MSYDKNNKLHNLTREIELTTPYCSILPSIDGSMNLARETKKQHNKKIITYPQRSKIRDRENFTL